MKPLSEAYGCVLGAQEARAKQAASLAATTGATLPGRRLVGTSGSSEFDRALGRMLLHVSSVFEVYPGFTFMDGSDSFGAFACPDTIFTGTNGTVFFGAGLLRRVLSTYNDGDIAIMGICAHEFAHIYQFKNGWHKTLATPYPTVKHLELHADYLAGYFVAQRRQRFPDFHLQGLGKLFSQLGDTAYNNRGHHGTSDERVAAIEAGYRFGMSGDASLSNAAYAGARLALSL